MGQKLDILSERDKFSIIARQAIGEFGGIFSQGVEYKLRPNLLIRGEVELVNFFGAGFRFHGIYRF